MSTFFLMQKHSLFESLFWLLFWSDFFDRHHPANKINSRSLSKLQSPRSATWCSKRRSLSEKFTFKNRYLVQGNAFSVKKEPARASRRPAGGQPEASQGPAGGQPAASRRPARGQPGSAFGQLLLSFWVKKTWFFWLSQWFFWVKKTMFFWLTRSPDPGSPILHPPCKGGVKGV